MTKILVYVMGLMALTMYSCRTYKQNIIFKTDSTVNWQNLEYSKSLAEKNYRIQMNDKLNLRVYTHDGERIIDPDFELSKGLNNQNLTREEADYLVMKDGMVRFPMVGLVHLDGLTLMEAEEVLQELYSHFYKDPYVRLRFNNKRVIVLGSPGGKVIPLENDDTNLIEILALAGGLDNQSKGHNIRLIRGDLKNPQVQLINLSTIEGMKQADLKIYSGDIIYVEPVRKVFMETIADITPFLSLVISFATLVILIQSLQ